MGFSKGAQGAFPGPVAPPQPPGALGLGVTEPLCAGEVKPGPERDFVQVGASC